MPAKTQLTTGTSATTTPATGGTTAPAVSQPAGNAAAQDRLKKVAGPIGRVWNHILGQPDGNAGTGGATADRAMLRAYLDKRLGLAEGEMFRGMKLDGVADKLVETLDTDRDGKVTWPEFQAFEGQILSVLAPGADKAGADVGTLANAQHQRIAGRDGKADLGELADAGEAALPQGTEHAGLIAQLGARVAIDAVDRDEGGKRISERSLSKDEWTGAAAEAAARRK